MRLYQTCAVVCSCALAAMVCRAANVSAPAKVAASASAAKPARSPGLALARSLSLRDRIAQLIIVTTYGDYPRSDDPEYKTLARLIRQDHVGGFIVANRVRNGSVMNANPFEMGAFINRMQRLARTPLLVASDFEHGASMRVSETAKFPYFMAYGAAHDIDETQALGAATAREARALGVNWIFAPDADVNNNPDNPIINTRSYGADPQKVASGVAAFIEGAHSDRRNYVLVTAKHFPGHGDTAEDSHMQLARLEQPRERIESVELVPFRAAIEHGVDSIMTAHMSVPAFEPEPIPATVSKGILTGLLREELGYTGLIVTDAMNMQGVASLYSQGEAAVRAIEAGADMILMPSDPEVCIRALLEAVQSGRISRRRIDESAARVLAAKQRVGLFRTRFVNLDQISDKIKDPALEQAAQTVADQAITVLKDDQHLFPIPDPDAACLVIITDGPFSTHGQALMTELGGHIPALKTYMANAMMPDDVLAAITADSSHCKRIYVAAFVAVAAYRGSVELQGPLSIFLRNLIHGPAPVALVSLGNPYLVRDFPTVAAYATTFSTTVTSETAAAQAILGDIAISGKTPVSIPGFAKMGDGLAVPAKPKLASNQPR